MRQPTGPGARTDGLRNRLDFVEERSHKKVQIICASRIDNLAVRFLHMKSVATWMVMGGIGFVALAAISRAWWLYRSSLDWPTADGSITRLDLERRSSPGEGHHFQATFSYDFRARDGGLFHGTWSKDFSSQQDAREFAERELPIGRRVIVRFHPKNPSTNDLELDSWTYAGDRPLDLNV